MVQKGIVKKIPLLIIAGPTGVGKTQIAIECFDSLNCELISADSMQVYKNCDIATAKLEKELLKQYPHYNIDIKDPIDEYSVAEFKEDTTKIIQNVSNAGKLPIIVGGTGLYIDSLLFPYDFCKSPKDNEYRDYLLKILEEKGNEFLYQQLVDIDPISASNIDCNNAKRIIRALEICHSSGKKLSDFERNNFNTSSIFDYNIIFINKDREILYDTINKRVDEMIADGLINEAQKIYNLQKSTSKNLQISKAIGYSELFEYFDNKVSLEFAIEKIKQHSRNYAKRQITWYKRYTSNIDFMSNNTQDEHKKIINFIKEKYKNFAK